jgi:hypothetical protein
MVDTDFQFMKLKTFNAFQRTIRLAAVMMACLFASNFNAARASVAYGTVNNFDTVNDTSNVCHGFEIELDDIRTTDITYTYDYNHYGTPKITEFTSSDSLGLHTNVLVDYEAVWTNTGWSAHTAIPTNNIPPTQGHAFTNPSLNFGGEHFGVGYRNSPSKVRYHWLLDGGAHTLALGPPVNVSTPVFTVNVAGNQAQVMPAIPAPVLPQIPSLADPLVLFEFGDATWVKVIATTSHTNNPIELRELVTPDTNNPSARDWRNGEPSEVETEWQLLQTDFASGINNPTNGVGGNFGQLQNHTNNVASDDVVTYRYEYYAYIGPYADWDTHQALCEIVAPDGIHGVGIVTNNTDVIDLSTNVVVGKFLGAQMSAMAAAPPIGLVDHLPDAEEGVLYPTRCVVIAGNNTNFTATCAGLPAGMTFEAANGWVGNTPSTSGVFIVTVTLAASNSPVLMKNYPLLVTPPGVIPPPHSSVDTGVSPINSGITTGDGVYTNGSTASVTATPNAGCGFLNWTENGVVVSASASYHFTNVVNQSLVANFSPHISALASPPHSLILAWLTNFSGYILQQNSDLRTTSWTPETNAVSVVVGSNHQATIPTTNGTRYFRLTHP